MSEERVDFRNDFNRKLRAIEAAYKLAMAQVQFAHSVVKHMQPHLGSFQSEDAGERQ
jgi:hypothetical protein